MIVLNLNRYCVDLNTGYNLILSPVKLINSCYELAKQYCSKPTKFYILGIENVELRMMQ